MALGPRYHPAQRKQPVRMDRREGASGDGLTTHTHRHQQESIVSMYALRSIDRRMRSYECRKCDAEEKKEIGRVDADE
jgi:hypothetical protein